MPITQPSIIITGSEEQLEALQDLLAELQLKANLTETQPISGTVEVSNFPESETFDGNVTVTNFPSDPATATLQSTQIARLETIRDHLADIKGYTDSLELLLTNLNGYVDGLETLLGAANTTQTSIAGFVDQLEGYTDGIESKLDTLNSKDFATQTTLAQLLSELQNKADANEIQGVAVSNFPSSQAVSVSNFPATQAVSASSLPLPTGAATDTVVAAIRDRLPTTTGANTAANSLPVTLSTDGQFATSFGRSDDGAASSDTATASYLSLFKRFLSRFTSLIGLLPSALTASGNFKINIAEISSTSTSTGLIPVTSVGFANSEFASTFTANQSTSAPSRDTQLLRNIVRGFVFSDQSGTIAMEQSTDASNWRPMQFTNGSYTISHTGGTNATPYEFKMYARYYRMKYTNGSVASTTMQMASSLFTFG